MFAILITEENLPEIDEHQKTLPPGVGHFYARPYLVSKVSWYYVMGILTPRGDQSWSAYPQEFFDRNFEYDADKIKTDWDQIVHN